MNIPREVHCRKKHVENCAKATSDGHTIFKRRRATGTSERANELANFRGPASKQTDHTGKLSGCGGGGGCRNICWIPYRNTEALIFIHIREPFYMFSMSTLFLFLSSFMYFSKPPSSLISFFPFLTIRLLPLISPLFCDWCKFLMAQKFHKRMFQVYLPIGLYGTVGLVFKPSPPWYYVVLGWITFYVVFVSFTLLTFVFHLLQRWCSFSRGFHLRHVFPPPPPHSF